MDGSANHQLLFGVLAIQNHFIGEESLRDAIQIWTHEKSLAVADILVANGKLSADERQLLDALVRHHLARNENDSEKSLAAISSAPPIHASLRELNATELFDGLNALPETQASHSQERGTNRQNGPTTRRFRVLRPHAKGGLGEVYVAEDIELRREVALKEIQPQYADYQQSRTRFLLEAEITGGLEHPGIVPVYGLGQYADGRPFYAMRFIRGDSLAEAINRFYRADNDSRDFGERTVELRKLLGRFIDVCEAMEYAHSRGVLHRDLKPGNIMLGRYGETLVVDWGLAKALGYNDPAVPSQEPALRPQSGDSVEQTMQGSAMGTPSYMSPEQAAGQLDRLGPASDVYSLGATLYCLLTGKAPFSGPETLKKVKVGDFLPPLSLNPRVPQSLNAVCLKAMSLRPEDRYLSPRSLAEDIERWLADEPVSCFQEPRLLRAKRWARRHPKAVVGTSATLIVGLLAVMVVGFILARTNEQLRTKNDALASANQREVQLTKKANESAEIAKSQSHLALKSLQVVVFDIQRKLQNQPGAGELRRTLLKAAISQLEEVSKEFVASADIDSNTAAALLDLSDTLRRFETEDAQQLEDPSFVSTAYAAVVRAKNIYKALVKETPGDPILEHGLSLSLDKIGDVQLQLGRTEDALRSFEESLERRRLRLATSPDDLELQKELSMSYTHIGDVQMQSEQMKDSLESYSKALAIDERIANAEVANEDSQRSLAVSYDKLGSALLEVGQSEQALENFQQSMVIDARLADAHPESQQAQRDLSHAYGNIGNVFLQQSQAADALPAFQRSVEIMQRLVEQDRADILILRDLSVCTERVGDAQTDLGKNEDAIESFQRALEISLELGKRDPADVWAQRDVAYSYNKVGDALLNMGRYAESLERYNDALVIREKLATSSSDDVIAQRELAISYTNIGEVHYQADEFAESLEAFQKASMIDQEILLRQPDEIRVQRDAKITITRLGDVQLALGQLAEAKQSFQKMLDLALKMSAESPGSQQPRSDLARAWLHLAVFYHKQHEYEQAMEAHKKALAILDELGAHEESLQLLKELLGSLLWIGRTSLAQGNAPQALEYWNRLKKLVEESTLLDSRMRQSWMLEVDSSIQSTTAAKNTPQN